VPGLAVAALVFLGGFLTKAPPGPPRFRQLTFQRGEIGGARFSNDGLEVVYDLLQGGGDPKLLSLRIDYLEETIAGEAPARLLGVSTRGEWAVQLEPKRDLDSLELFRGTLALAVGRGTAPRAMIQDVVSADFSPTGDLAVVRCVAGRFSLECPAGTVRLERGTYLSNPRFSRDGRYLAFLECAHQDLNQSDYALCLLNLASGELRTLPRRGRFQGLAWRGREAVTALRTERGATEILAFTVNGADRKVGEIPGGWSIQDADTAGRLLLSEARVETSIRVWRPDIQPQDLSVRGGGNLFGLSPDGRRVLIQALASSQPGKEDPTLYSRSVEGGLPTFLGRGSVGSLSPDGTWLAVVAPGSRAAIHLMPTGPQGQARQMEVPQLAGIIEIQWTADGNGILAAGHVPGRPSRVWLLDLQGGQPKPVSPEGVTCSADWIRISPNGRYLVAEENRKLVLVDLTAPDRIPQDIPGLAKGEFTAGWTRDSRRVFVWRQGALPREISTVDVATGQRQHLLTLTTEDMGQILTNPFVSADGKVVAANLVKLPSNLYLLEGLKD